MEIENKNKIFINNNSDPKNNEREMKKQIVKSNIQEISENTIEENKKRQKEKEQTQIITSTLTEKEKTCLIRHERRKKERHVCLPPSSPSFPHPTLPELCSNPIAFGGKSNPCVSDSFTLNSSKPCFEKGPGGGYS